MQTVTYLVSDHNEADADVLISTLFHQALLEQIQPSEPDDNLQSVSDAAQRLGLPLDCSLSQVLESLEARGAVHVHVVYDSGTVNDLYVPAEVVAQYPELSTQPN